jgi:hypothetical protein
MAWLDVPWAPFSTVTKRRVAGGASNPDGLLLMSGAGFDAS